jgi:hypothetical protein
MKTKDESQDAGARAAGALASAASMTKDDRGGGNGARLTAESPQPTTPAESTRPTTPAEAPRPTTPAEATVSA